MATSNDEEESDERTPQASSVTFQKMSLFTPLTSNARLPASSGQPADFKVMCCIYARDQFNHDYDVIKDIPFFRREPPRKIRKNGLWFDC